MKLASISILAQQALGNQAMQRMLQAKILQAKLTVNPPDDEHEKEADQVANTVMRMPDPLAGMPTSETREEDEEKNLLQTKPLPGQNLHLIQRQEMGKEEDEEKKPLQTKPLSSQDALIQREEVPEDEEKKKEEEMPIQAKFLSGQRQSMIQKVMDTGAEEEEEEEPLQTKLLSDETPSILDEARDEKCRARNEDEETGLISRKVASEKVGTTVEEHLLRNQGQGQTLDLKTRDFFEPRFGQDFSGVRVHSDAQSGQASKTLNAQAFTTGQDIYFGAGHYQPGTEQGQQLLAHELTHVIQQQALPARSKPSGIRALQRQQAPATIAAPAPAPALALSPVDDLVGASVLDTLDRFQNIPIDVTGSQQLPPGFIGPPAPVTVRVTVHAQYFINTNTARAHYATARRNAQFAAVIGTLNRRGEMSLLEGAHGPRSAGRAVELGKATPEDIKKFVEEALAQGIVRNYAIRRRDITASQQLIDLAPAVLQALIQRWMRETGVGVDCSGFVQQAAIRAREQEREVISFVNNLTSTLGLPPIPLPPEISPRERPASSFTGGPRVREPRNLRPGDVWVVTGGGHIRIVSAVREVTLPSGATTIEFDTAESSGGSTQPEPGPVSRTWRTHSLTQFQPMTPAGHRGGTFHRIR